VAHCVFSHKKNSVGPYGAAEREAVTSRPYKISTVA
jgi:hypothetical protein